MNTLFVLTCKICGGDTDCRVGFSNRRIQPMRFSCPHCASPVEIVLDTSKAPAFELTLVNGEQLADRQYAPFDGRNPFVDLHLDFPVSFGDYKMGFTPFLAALQRIRDDVGDEGRAYALFGCFSRNLNQLNFFADRNDEVRVAIKLYFGKNKQLFKRRVEQLLGIDLGPSLRPEDVNAALYLLISQIFQPFVHMGAVREFVEDLNAMIEGLARSKAQSFEAFVHHIVESGFLMNIQRDCLELYPEIYEAELALRPAIFLDLVNGSDDSMIAGRVSADDFPTYKDLYKDLCEVLNRQMILVAGINNLIHRDSHDAFAATRDGPALSSLDKFADKTLSDKFKYLDDCWFLIDREVVNAGIRNAIAHHITEYDERNQMITYFPEKEGLRQEKGQTMSFLAFLRLVLQIFREIHYLNHLIKMLLYFHVLVRSKDKPG